MLTQRESHSETLALSKASAYLALMFSAILDSPNQALTHSPSIPNGIAFDKLAQRRMTRSMNQNVRAL